MLKRIYYVLTSFLFFTAALFSQSSSLEVAITIDDLPTVSLMKDSESAQEITNNLLLKIKKYNIPAIGFVNEGKLYNDSEPDERKVSLLKQWIEAGLELGNHTYSHRSLNRINADEYTEDILKGELITRRLMKDSGRELSYFRHPFLHTGRDNQTRERVHEFLKRHNYTIAPVTIDNAEWIFARAYDKAFVDADSAMMKKIVDEYIIYMESKFEHFEYVSNEMFGQQIRQILLIHANKINADHLDKLAYMMIKRGYKFISLEEALEDKAYQSPDAFFGAGGISWLHRWGLTAGMNKDIFKSDLPAPDFILEYSGVESE